MKSKFSGVVETSPYFDLHEALTSERKKGLLRTDNYNGRKRLIRMDKQPAELNLERFLLKGYAFEHVFISERFRCPVYARNGVYRFNYLAWVKLSARLNALNHLQAEIEASALPDTEVISGWFARWLEKEEEFSLDTSAISKNIQTDVSLSETIQSYIGETMGKIYYRR